MVEGRRRYPDLAGTEPGFILRAVTGGWGAVLTADSQLIALAEPSRWWLIGFAFPPNPSINNQQGP